MKASRLAGADHPLGAAAVEPGVAEVVPDRCGYTEPISAQE